MIQNVKIKSANRHRQ